MITTVNNPPKKFKNSNLPVLDGSLEPNTSDLSAKFDRTLVIAQDWLRQFAVNENVRNRIEAAFGSNFDVDSLETILQDWVTSSFVTLPRMEFRSASDINYAYGAFASATDTIYLSTEFLTSSQPPEIIAGVLIAIVRTVLNRQR